jgi:uncharacterized protein YfaA (DUF2138 family)
MIDWEAKNKARIEQLKADLLECEKWIDEFGWSKLPKGVRKIICMGEVHSEDLIKIYVDRIKEK